ncbi:hypothetical protein Tco_0769679 [Tanacetum coccineum]|uniref:Uncharacterized protein n=1 Tax=Tanacetum coccineum TaxID=301880 RepID=A0ABQ4ZA21_9ASTR
MLSVEFSISTYLNSVSHIDLQEPVSGIGTSKHQVTSSGHIGYSGHSSSANPIAANVTENVSGTVVGDHGVWSNVFPQQDNSVNTLHVSGDRNTSAGVNIIGGVITPASSDGTSITVTTGVPPRYMYLGACDQTCQHCGARYWYEERLKSYANLLLSSYTINRCFRVVGAEFYMGRQVQ